MKHQTVLDSITLLVDIFIRQSKTYETVSLVESMLKWNISHLDLIKSDVPALALDVDLAITDLRLIASKTVECLTNSGDSARLPASASALADDFPVFFVDSPRTSVGQGGNQTPKQQCKNHSVNELFCCCDDCTTQHYVLPLYDVDHYELVLS